MTMSSSDSALAAIFFCLGRVRGPEEASAGGEVRRGQHGGTGQAGGSAPVLGSASRARAVEDLLEVLTVQRADGGGRFREKFGKVCLPLEIFFVGGFYFPVVQGVDRMKTNAEYVYDSDLKSGSNQDFG